MSGYRIVGPSSGRLWRCQLCGAAVAHVDDHAAWHESRHGVKYGEHQDDLGGPDGTSTPTTTSEETDA